MKKIIETQRTYLREMTQNDYADLCEILQDSETMYAYEHAFSDEEVQNWLDWQLNNYEKHGFGLWAVIDKDTEEFIGQVGLTVQKVEDKEELEIGYLLKRKHWHKGYALEAAKACKEYAFNTLNKDKVVSIIRDNNYPSQHVAERVGMKIEGQFTKHYYNMDMPHYVYSIEKDTNASIFHKMTGENIYFKALEIKDAEKVHKYASDKDVKRFIGWRLMAALEETREHIEKMIKNENEGTSIYASVVLKGTEEVIGTAMLFKFDKEASKAEVGYVFDKDCWGKGYGTETVALMSSFAFETLKLHKLYGNVVDTNLGSARVLEKNGFVLEGRFKDHYFIEGKYYDGLYFGRIESEE
ncbi:GNAT family N-acetyltransferase [Clostridium swellfunianum]|uniref:GNAT family N-acetyltransferase n=1 Tax=Clostridium swellfunianum TaxID=1367462 RepID=UPI0032D58DD6